MILAECSRDYIRTNEVGLCIKQHKFNGCKIESKTKCIGYV